MDIDRLKKRAKNLKRLLPAFVQDHGASPSLAACQELAARLEGFPSFHAAQRDEAAAEPSQSTTSRLGALEFRIWDDVDGWRSPRPWKEDGHGALLLVRRESEMAELEGMLDEHIEKHLSGPDRNLSQMSPAALRKLVTLARKAYKEEPGFLYATALEIGALIELGESEKAAWIGRSRVGRIDLELLPPAFAGTLSYTESSNRGYLQLNHHYVLALIACGRRQEADVVCEKMLALCPYDNLGMRYLLSDGARVAREKQEGRSKATNAANPV